MSIEGQPLHKTYVKLLLTSIKQTNKQMANDLANVGWIFEQRMIKIEHDQVATTGLKLGKDVLFFNLGNRDDSLEERRLWRLRFEMNEFCKETDCNLAINSNKK